MIGYSNGEAIAVYFDDRAATFLDKKQGETFRRTTLNSPHFIPQPRLGNTHAPWPQRFVHKSTFSASDDPTKTERQELHVLSLKLISVITLRRPMWIRRAETKPSSLHISDSKAVFRIGSKTTTESLSGNLFLKSVTYTNSCICPIERKAIEGWAIEQCSYLLKTGKFKLFCKLGIL